MEKLRKWLLAGALIVAASPFAYAANSRLSDLSAAAAVSATDLVYLVQSVGAGGVKGTMTQVATYVMSLFSKDFTCTSGGVCTVTKTNNVAFGTMATGNFATPSAIGGTTPAAGAFTTLSATSTVSGAGFSAYLASPQPIGSVVPSTGAFTTLSASSTVSGAGFSTYLASPPAIGGTAPAAGKFTTLTATGSITGKSRSVGTATVTVSATTDWYLCLDPTSNAIAVNLPASPAAGLTYVVKDCTGQAATHNITITPNTGNVDGLATFVMSTAFQSVAVTYTGAQWSIN